MSELKLPRVVIVGAGFGGLQAAKAMKRLPAKVTVIDRRNHHLFQPLLYQVATATLSPADIAAPIRHVLRNHENTEVLMAEVQGVDVENRQVLLNEHKIPYDMLVLATGATHGYFGKNEWGNFAPGLKTIGDATDIRRRILTAFEAAEMEPGAEKKAHWLHFIVIGGGPTGVEMAGAIAELSHRALAADFRSIDPRSARITLLEAGSRLLAAFSETSSRRAKESLENLNVDVRLESRVEVVDEKGVIVLGERIFSKTIVWAAGVVASPAAKWLSADCDRAGRVKVETDLTVPKHPEIFVIGDTAWALDQKGKMLPGVAQVALQQGRYVAEVIERRLEKRKPPKPFQYWDKGNMATIGRSAAVAEMGKIKLSGILAWFAWLGVHIYYLIGFRNRLLVLFEWSWSYFAFYRGARLITGEPRKSDGSGGDDGGL